MNNRKDSPRRRVAKPKQLQIHTIDASLLDKRLLRFTAELQAAKEQIAAILNPKTDGRDPSQPDRCVQQANAALAGLLRDAAAGAAGETFYRLLAENLVELLRTITEHQPRETLLHESEMRYHLLAENVSDVIASTGADGIRRFITQNCFFVLAAW